MNALKSGIDAKSQIIRGEKAANLEALQDEYYLQFHPSDPEQRMLVDILIDAEWLLRRFRTVEAQLWEFEITSAFNLEEETPLGKAHRKCDISLSRLQRRIDIAQRNYRAAIQDLKRLQAEEPPPQPDLPAPPSLRTPVKNGFVPQPAPAPSSPSAAPTQQPQPSQLFTPPAPSLAPSFSGPAMK